MLAPVLAWLWLEAASALEGESTVQVWVLPTVQLLAPVWRRPSSSCLLLLVTALVLTSVQPTVAALDQVFEARPGAAPRALPSL